MGIPQIVVDTNVILSAARSGGGASARLLELVGTGRFEIYLSMALVLEYEEVLRRGSPIHRWGAQEIDDVLNYLCSVGIRQEVYFHWRPMLPDADDDFLLELALAGGIDLIVTHNVRDLAAASDFGIRVMRPAEFLRELETKK